MSVQVTTPALLPSGHDLTPSKRRLYEVAIELFGQQGYHAVSIRDIATALGQQSSAIYFHVSSKQDLLYELAVIGHQAHYEALRDAVMDAGADPRDQLTAVARAHVRQHLDFPSLARLTNRELRALSSEHHQAVVAIRSQAETLIVDVIQRGVRLGAFPTTDPLLDAKAIGAMGMRLPEWWTPDSPRSREEIIERYAGYALKVVS
ncbi:MAG: TetR family transcriptional regulator [Frankiales bacterium]|jgi:AcrR family transcriptional regulator|nr:TetR family transcriptional regulator [Frankiales bacterium]